MPAMIFLQSYLPGLVELYSDMQLRELHYVKVAYLST